MPAVLVALFGILVQFASSAPGRVLLALGFGYVTYQGIGSLLSWTLDAVKSAMAGLPGDVANFVAWVWLDKAITMVFSAYTSAMLVKGLRGGALTKLKVK